MNLLNVSQKLGTEEQAWDYLIRSRWPDGVRCIACDHDKCYLIATTGKTGKPCRLFECADCGLHFSATTGTLFHDSHLPLHKWFMAMALICEAKKGMSAMQVQRHIGCAYKTAWYLCHRIRKAMEELNAGPLGGAGKVVEVDETYLGGRITRKGVKAAKDAKVAILGIAERNGRVHLRRIDNAKAATLKPILKEKIDAATEQVITDGHPTYVNVIPSIVPVKQHVVADHSKELEEFGELSAKTVEGAFSLFKRGVIGSYHKLSKDHLDSYLNEFCWRYNRRKLQPFMFSTLLSELTKKQPMTYKKLTREVF
jgi:transposase-like protein